MRRPEFWSSIMTERWCLLAASSWSPVRVLDNRDAKGLIPVRENYSPIVFCRFLLRCFRILEGWLGERSARLSAPTSGSPLLTQKTEGLRSAQIPPNLLVALLERSKAAYKCRQRDAPGVQITQVVKALPGHPAAQKVCTGRRPQKSLRWSQKHKEGALLCQRRAQVARGAGFRVCRSHGRRRHGGAHNPAGSGELIEDTSYTTREQE